MVVMDIKRLGAARSKFFSFSKLPLQQKVEPPIEPNFHFVYGESFSIASQNA